MNRKRFATFAAIALAFGLGFGSRAFTMEPHPEINAAQRLLAQANDHLARADHDFHGHRVKAMELIRGAQAELTAALASDR